MRTMESLPAGPADDKATDARMARGHARRAREQAGAAFRGTRVRSARLAKLGSFGCSASRLMRPVALLVLGACTAAAAHAYSPARAHPAPGYLGVSLVDLDPDTVTRLHLKDTHGALIASIDRDAPAAAAGLRAHDVIVEASGHKVDSVEALRRRLRDTSAGTTLLLRISREGAEQSISVRLGDQSEIEERAWNQHFNTPEAAPATPQPGGEAAANSASNSAPI